MIVLLHKGGIETILVVTLLNTYCKIMSKLLTNPQKHVLSQLIYAVDISFRR